MARRSSAVRPRISPSIVRANCRAEAQEGRQKRRAFDLRMFIVGQPRIFIQKPVGVIAQSALAQAHQKNARSYNTSQVAILSLNSIASKQNGISIDQIDIAQTEVAVTPSDLIEQSALKQKFFPPLKGANGCRNEDLDTLSFKQIRSVTEFIDDFRQDAAQSVVAVVPSRMEARRCNHGKRKLFLREDGSAAFLGKTI
jgi:hypothetical protein